MKNYIHLFFFKHKRLKSFILKLMNNRLYSFFHYSQWQDDKKYLIKLYKRRLGTVLNLDNPKSFNEKNNWRKLYDRNPIYTKIVDKYLVKEFVENRVGCSHTFKLLGVWDNPKAIDLATLPKEFVLKVNHAGGVIVCRDKAMFDFNKAKKELAHGLKINYFCISREWPYKNVKRKIIAEQYMGENLTEYRNFCFNGHVKYILVSENKSSENGRKPQPNFCGCYDTNWQKTDMELNHPSINKVINKPINYDEMVKIAEALSKDISFVRVDCYIIDNNVYVGEMTFFPYGGFMLFKDEKWNLLLGDLERL